MELLSQLCKWVRGGQPPTGVEACKEEIRTALRQKKCLVILDDVWTVRFVPSDYVVSALKFHCAVDAVGKRSGRRNAIRRRLACDAHYARLICW